MTIENGASVVLQTVKQKFYIPYTIGNICKKKCVYIFKSKQCQLLTYNKHNFFFDNL